MVDRLNQNQRSALMREVKAKNTKPELIVRSTAHRLGYRFRLHVKDLPGTPDLVFPSRKKVIFVHGCFWHRHEACPKASMPASNVAFWKAKFLRNTARDARNETMLRAAGWETLTIWECEARRAMGLEVCLLDFLDGGGEDAVERMAHGAKRPRQNFDLE